MELKKELWGKSACGKEIYLYTLKNESGAYVQLSSVGAGTVSVVVPDKDGVLADVALGYPEASSYFGDGPCAGKVPGRFANRIALGKFTLDGVEYELPINNGPNHLHGGPTGCHARVWDAEQLNDQELVLRYTFAYYEEGFPGEVSMTVKYSLTNDNELVIDYRGTTNKKTVVNMTSHGFFSLTGIANPTPSQLDTILTINADFYVPIDENSIPTGEIRKVEGTPFDFRTPTAIGDRINDETNEQIVNGVGYDHNWILNTNCDLTKCFGTLYDPNTGIFMEMFTDQPGVQFYAGNFLDGSFVGKKGVKYPRRSAFCFETQHYPDSPNHPEWPSTTLLPGENYMTTTMYKFSTK